MGNAVWQQLGRAWRCGAGVALLLGWSGLGAAWAMCDGGDHPHLPQGPFVDAGGGLVRHVPSQTVWKRCAEGQTWVRNTCVGQPLELTAPAAVDRVYAVNASAPGTQNAGQTSWRLPRLHELRWLVEPGCSQPAINLTQFPRTPPAPFWTETPFVEAPFAAWTVDFARGDAYGAERLAKAAVRLVRASPPEMARPAIELAPVPQPTRLQPAPRPGGRAPAAERPAAPGPGTDTVQITRPPPPLPPTVAVYTPPALICR